MQSFLVSTGLVAVAEIGDKTQLLSIVLAARFQRPWPILAGILLATLLNHGLAAWLGAFAAGWLDGPWVRWVLGLSFFAFAAWALVPDRLDDGDARAPVSRNATGILFATALAFFLVEMGDKTQVATVALAARFAEVATVAAGTTLGMLLANAPAVWLGDALVRRLPMARIRIGAALLFAATGLWTLLS